jgi:hypothetical protein
MENEEINRKKYHKFQCMRIVLANQVVHRIYETFRNRWEQVENIKRITRAGKMITRAARRYLRRMAQFKIDRYHKKVGMYVSTSL